MQLSSAFFFSCYLCVFPWEEKQLVYYVFFKDRGKLLPVQELLRNY